MSASVASKNLYELLGNDPPEDEQPSKAPREVVKNATTSKKRDEKPVPTTAAPRGGTRGGRDRYAGNEAAFRDRDAGRDSNRSRTTHDEEGVTYARGGGAGRGGRGRRGRDFDRHSATGRDEHEKQADHGWGANKGESEWNDELAGQELAQKDAAGADPADPNAAAEGADAEAAAQAEEEDKTKTYDEYLAELAARRAELGAPSDVRRPNEGSRNDKKWAHAKALEKTGEEEVFFIGETKDKSRNRERKTKQLLEIEPRYEQRDRRGGDRGGRGGRGGARGDRGGRGDRGDRSAPRGGHRGGRAGGNQPVNTEDTSAFPALGA